jgi:hypothetical protein
VWIKENEGFLFENVDPLLKAAHFSSEFIPSKVRQTIANYRKKYYIILLFQNQTYC